MIRKHGFLIKNNNRTAINEEEIQIILKNKRNE